VIIGVDVRPNRRDFRVQNWVQYCCTRAIDGGRPPRTNSCGPKRGVRPCRECAYCLGRRWRQPTVIIQGRSTLISAVASLAETYKDAMLAKLYWRLVHHANRSRRRWAQAVKLSKDGSYETVPAMLSPAGVARMYWRRRIGRLTLEQPLSE
jgi:hypothetical protein